MRVTYPADWRRVGGADVSRVPNRFARKGPNMQPIPNTLETRPARTRAGLRRVDIVTMPAAILAVAVSWHREVTR